MDGSSSHPLELSDDDSSYSPPRQPQGQGQNPLLDPTLAISTNCKFRVFRGGNREILPSFHLAIESDQGMHLLHEQTILEFARKELPIQENLVHWFYKNVTIFADFRKVCGHKLLFKVVFPHITLEYNDTNLIQDFGLLGEGERCNFFYNWPCDKGVEGSQMLTAMHLNRFKNQVVTTANLEFMDGEGVFLEFLLRKILLPIPNMTNRCSKQSTLLLHHIKNQNRVNWPFVIAQHMLKCGGTGNIGFLPYGGLITHIVRGWNLLFQQSNFFRSNPFDRAFLTGFDIYLAHTKFVKFDDRKNLSQRERVALEQDLERCGLIRGLHYPEDDDVDSIPCTSVFADYDSPDYAEPESDSDSKDSE